jgi:hypothetical protein
VGERLGQDLVPDGLWEIVEPLIPPQTERPQGGGTRHVDDRAVFEVVPGLVEVEVAVPCPHRP